MIAQRQACAQREACAQLQACRSRGDLAALASGLGVELGVAAGAYSDLLLERGTLRRLWSIDRWSDHHDAAEERMARARLSRWGARSIVLRMTFAEAVGIFPDACFDFVYVDGYAHTGQDGGRTLRDWWPKLKRGGIFAGHDYHPHWKPTVEAVDAFAAEHGLRIHVLPDDQYASWATIRPMTDD